MRGIGMAGVESLLEDGLKPGRREQQERTGGASVVARAIPTRSPECAAELIPREPVDPKTVGVSDHRFLPSAEDPLSRIGLVGRMSLKRCAREQVHRHTPLDLLTGETYVPDGPASEYPMVAENAQPSKRAKVDAVSRDTWDYRPTIRDLPEGIMGEVLRAVSRSSFAYSLVCRRWAELRQSAQARLSIRPEAAISADILAKELRQFSNIEDVRCHLFSVDWLDDSFLALCLRWKHSLRRLSIEHASVLGCNITESGLSKFFQSCTMLRVLELLQGPVTGWQIPASLSNFTSLQHLKFGSSHADRVCQNVVSSLPSSIDQLQSLKSLSIDSRKLAALPASICNLTSLTMLSLNCPSLEDIPDSISRLASLRVLKLNPARLASLPESICKLAHMASLAISCPNVRTLPENIGQLKRLKVLDISSCFRLGSLQTLLLTLTGLEELLIGPAWPSVAQNMAELSRLKALTIKWATPGKLGDSLCHLLHLKALAIKRSPVAELDDSLCQLSGLEELCIESCHSLRQLPDGMGQMRSLQRLVIQDCKALQSVPESIAQLTCLESVSLIGLAGLTVLPKSLLSVSFPLWAATSWGTFHRQIMNVKAERHAKE